MINLQPLFITSRQLENKRYYDEIRNCQSHVGFEYNLAHFDNTFIQTIT